MDDDTTVFHPALMLLGFLIVIVAVTGYIPIDYSILMMLYLIAVATLL